MPDAVLGRDLEDIPTAAGTLAATKRAASGPTNRSSAPHAVRRVLDPVLLAAVAIYLVAQTAHVWLVKAQVCDRLGPLTCGWLPASFQHPASSVSSSCTLR